MSENPNDISDTGIQCQELDKGLHLSSTLKGDITGNKRKENHGW